MEGADPPRQDGRPDCALRHAWKQGVNCPPSSSAGRLFDAAAALLGLCAEASFEGQAAMRLEAVSAVCDGGVELPLVLEQGIWRADWSPLVPLLLDAGREPARRGGLFHASLAGLIAAQALKLRETHGVNRVGLCGGVFQNRLLSEQAAQALHGLGFEVLLPTEIPANDAGISFGQIIEAAATIA